MKQTIIYNRTSTKQQSPELQLKDCETLALRLNLTDYEVMQEKESAFNDKSNRDVFELIKEGIRKGQVKNLIVWDYDRLFRNRLKTIEFIRGYSKLGLTVYSFRQEWFETIKKIPSPFNEIVYDLMLQVISWIAEEESRKKSDRTKLSIIKDKGITKSYKGNKWGRKELPDKLKEDILKLRAEGRTIREIAKELYYWDKSNNKKFVSIAYVHKIISENKGGS